MQIKAGVVVKFYGSVNSNDPTNPPPNNYRVEVNINDVRLLLDYRHLSMWNTTYGCMPKEEAMPLAQKIADILGVKVTVEDEPEKESYRR